MKILNTLSLLYKKLGRKRLGKETGSLNIMAKKIFAFFALMILSSNVFSAGASIGIPLRIFYNTDGYTYVLLKAGNNQVDCFHGSSYGSHRMSKSDPDYDSKLSLIMMAFAASKTLHLQDATPNGTNAYCDIDLITVTDH